MTLILLSIQVDEYARLINSVRVSYLRMVLLSTLTYSLQLAFSSRVRTYQAWQAADSDVRRVKQAHEKNRAQGRIVSERMGHSLSQIAEVLFLSASRWLSQHLIFASQGRKTITRGQARV